MKIKLQKIFLTEGVMAKGGDLMVERQTRADRMMEFAVTASEEDLREAMADWRADYGVEKGYVIPYHEVFLGHRGSWVLREERAPEVNEWGEVGA